MGDLDYEPAPGLLLGASAYFGESGQGIEFGGDILDVSTDILELHAQWRELRLEMLEGRVEAPPGRLGARPHGPDRPGNRTRPGGRYGI